MMTVVVPLHHLLFLLDHLIQVQLAAYHNTRSPGTAVARCSGREYDNAISSKKSNGLQLANRGLGTDESGTRTFAVPVNCGLRRCNLCSSCQKISRSVDLI